MIQSVIDIISSHLSNCNGEIHSHGSINFKHSSIVDFFKHLVDFERPDAHSIVENSVHIFEHFEFDSSSVRKRKGSLSNIEKSRVNRAFDAILPAGNGIRLRDELNIDYHVKNYVDNALANLQNHYAKIDSYIDNLKSNNIILDNNNVSVGFFIEDTTVLGNLSEPKANDWVSPPRPLILCHSKQFLDMFESLSKLDFCICASMTSSQSHLWYIDHESIPEYRKHELDFEELSIIDFTPQALGYSVTIEDSSIE